MGPQLEYCSTIWDPYTKENINKIEKVQNRAARFTHNNYQQQASVSNMVKDLGWPNLQHRRQHFNLIMFYKIAHGFIAIPRTILPPLSTHQHNTRYSHRQQFQIPQCRINAYKYSFVPRTIVHWSVLPAIVISCVTVDSFKDKLSATSMD